MRCRSKTRSVVVGAQGRIAVHSRSDKLLCSVGTNSILQLPLLAKSSSPNDKRETKIRVSSRVSHGESYPATLTQSIAYSRPFPTSMSACCPLSLMNFPVCERLGHVKISLRIIIIWGQVTACDSVAWKTSLWGVDIEHRAG